MSVKYKIAVVEDDVYFRFLINKTIKKDYDHEIFEYEDAESLFVRLYEIKPDIIILDLNLKKMSGIEALEKLNYSSNNSKIIILSGQQDVKVAVKAINLGAFEYITKDIGWDKLLIEALYKS